VWVPLFEKAMIHANYDPKPPLRGSNTRATITAVSNYTSIYNARVSLDSMVAKSGTHSVYLSLFLEKGPKKLRPPCPTLELIKIALFFRRWVTNLVCQLHTPPPFKSVWPPEFKQPTALSDRAPLSLQSQLNGPYFTVQWSPFWKGRFMHLGVYKILSPRKRKNDLFLNTPCPNWQVMVYFFPKSGRRKSIYWIVCFSSFTGEEICHEVYLSSRTHRM